MTKHVLRKAKPPKYDDLHSFCGRPAAEVDGLTELEARALLRDDPEGAKSLCRICFKASGVSEPPPIIVTVLVCRTCGSTILKPVGKAAHCSNRCLGAKAAKFLGNWEVTPEGCTLMMDNGGCKFR